MEGHSQEEGHELETWSRVVTLASTLKNEELLTVDADTLMHRLFWEETIRLFDLLQPRFRCTCSREKVGDMLRMLGQKEVSAAIAEQGALEIRCDFCGQAYDFNAEECRRLFTPDELPPPGSLLH